MVEVSLCSWSVLYVWLWSKDPSSALLCVVTHLSTSSSTGVKGQRDVLKQEKGFQPFYICPRPLTSFALFGLRQKDVAMHVCLWPHQLCQESKFVFVWNESTRIYFNTSVQCIYTRSSFSDQNVQSILCTQKLQFVLAMKHINYITCLDLVGKIRPKIFCRYTNL